MLAIENALSRVAGNRHAACNSTKAGGNHVKEILHTFAFRHNNVYLCIGKGGTRVLPFFHISPWRRGVMPEQPRKTAFLSF